MTRPGKTAGVLALLAALLIGSPVSAQNSDTYRNRDLRDQVRELREELANLRRSYEDDIKMSNHELRRLSAQLDRIERRLSELSSTTSARTSRFLDPDVPVVGAGTIRLVNRLAVTATVTIDGVTYTVPPLSTTTLRNQPTGMITYSVTATGFGVRTRRTPVRANETLTLTIY
jgi:hypothetical protein